MPLDGNVLLCGVRSRSRCLIKPASRGASVCRQVWRCCAISFAQARARKQLWSRCASAWQMQAAPDSSLTLWCLVQRRAARAGLGTQGARAWMPVKAKPTNPGCLAAQVDNQAYPVTVDALHTVFSPYGYVQKIAIFDKNGSSQVIFRHALAHACTPCAAGLVLTQLSPAAAGARAVPRPRQCRQCQGRAGGPCHLRRGLQPGAPPCAAALPGAQA